MVSNTIKSQDTLITTTYRIISIFAQTRKESEKKGETTVFVPWVTVHKSKGSNRLRPATQDVFAYFAQLIIRIVKKKKLFLKSSTFSMIEHSSPTTYHSRHMILRVETTRWPFPTCTYATTQKLNKINKIIFE